jgi:hypothetical protein
MTSSFSSYLSETTGGRDDGTLVEGGFGTGLSAGRFARQVKSGKKVDGHQAVTWTDKRRGSRLRALKRSLHETQHLWMLPKKQTGRGAEAHEALLDVSCISHTVVREKHNALSEEEIALAFRAFPRCSQVLGADEVFDKSE